MWLVIFLLFNLYQHCFLCHFTSPFFFLFLPLLFFFSPPQLLFFFQLLVCLLQLHSSSHNLCFSLFLRSPLCILRFIFSFTAKDAFMIIGSSFILQLCYPSRLLVIFLVPCPAQDFFLLFLLLLKLLPSMENLVKSFLN